MARRTAAMPALGVARVDLRQPGPEQQLVGVGRERRRALVQRPGLARAVGGHQLVGLARELVGARERDQPPQLDDRVARGPRPAGRSGPATASPSAGTTTQRRRLAAADVAALPLRGVERRQQPLGEVALGGLEARDHRGRHRVAGHHVGLGGDVLAGGVARARDAVGAGVDGDPARRVDERDLADRGERVGAEQRVERVGGAGARRQAVEPVRAVGRLDDGLRRDRPDARAGPDAERADREPVRVHGRAVLPRGRVEGDDRIRPVAHERATIPG